MVIFNREQRHIRRPYHEGSAKISKIPAPLLAVSCTARLSCAYLSGASGHRHLGSRRTSCFAGVRATPLPRRWVPLDARLLGLRPGWLLLGSWGLGEAATCGRSLDAGLLGLCGRPLRLACRLLGASRRVLR